MQIFVAGFDDNLTEAELRLAFEQFGPVQRARICTDIVTGRSRGFGFVSMNPVAGGLTAITELNGTIIGSGHRKIVVQKSNQLR